MTAPPSLDQLRDIHLPDASGAGLGTVPMTLLALALGVLVLGLALVLRRRARQRPLREARRELDRLLHAHAQAPDDIALTRGIGQLLRAYAARRFPQKASAGLAGDAWLAFLDAHGGAGAFSHGVGRVLATLPYAPHGSAHPLLDTPALAQLVRHWLHENRP